MQQTTKHAANKQKNDAHFNAPETKKNVAESKEIFFSKANNDCKRSGALPFCEMTFLSFLCLQHLNQLASVIYFLFI